MAVARAAQYGLVIQRLGQWSSNARRRALRAAVTSNDIVLDPPILSSEGAARRGTRRRWRRKEVLLTAYNEWQKGELALALR